MKDITPTFPEPSLADAIRRLRIVQMAWNNTHSRRESNTYEAFEVVLRAVKSPERTALPEQESAT